MTAPTCRLCRSALRRTFVDLGQAPLSNAFVSADALQAMEPHYPLHAYICEQCLLVQVADVVPAAAIFRDYLYFSSYSDAWLQHARTFAADMVQALQLGPQSLVVELASNDGYLLQYFQLAGVPVLGVEPAANVAAVARARGVPTEAAFFGVELARRLAAEGRQADLICANNVLAHVPDLRDFVAGLPILLKPGGVATLEFPHLLNLIAERQFDTIYHEHCSYFSLLVADRVLARHGLRVFDVEQLPTHGGSLRIHACHAGDAVHTASWRLSAALTAEVEYGIGDFTLYDGFADTVVEVKCALLEFLIDARRSGRLVAGYGAPAKGNTLLNYCGIGPELLAFTVDRSPHKQGRFLPGSRIPILPVDEVAVRRPDYLLILPWNLRDEIVGQMQAVRDWGGRFVLAIPQLQVF